jgi:hypothetical protein
MAGRGQDTSRTGCIAHRRAVVLIALLRTKYEHMHAIVLHSPAKFSGEVLREWTAAAVGLISSGLFAVWTCTPFVVNTSLPIKTVHPLHALPSQPRGSRHALLGRTTMPDDEVHTPLLDGLSLACVLLSYVSHAVWDDKDRRRPSRELHRGRGRLWLQWPFD